MTDTIKQWRSRLGLSQRDAAKRLGYSLKRYQEIERGANFQTGEPVDLDARTALAAAAIEHNLEPINADTYKPRYSQSSSKDRSDAMNTELFIPKGSMCAVCAKQAATTECGKLDFSKMPVLRRDNDGYVIVKCSEFERQEYRSGS